MPFSIQTICWRRMLASLVLPLAVAQCVAAQQAATQDEPTQAEQTAAEPRFVRIVRNKSDDPVSLETAIIRFKPADEAKTDVKVDLVGVVHVGDRAYYRKLNKLFKEYDAVLYELVAEEDANVPLPGRQSGHPVSLLQSGMKEALELEFQLDVIDYTAENFVHADMTPAEMAESMKNRDESFVKMFFRMMGQGAAQQSRKPTADADMVMALFSKDRPRQMKLIMAEQLQNVEGSVRVMEGPNGSTLIGERNGKAMKVLQQRIDAGDKKIAIFYGAGHLPDMEQRLVRDFDLQLADSEWLKAWNLKEAKAK